MNATQLIEFGFFEGAGGVIVVAPPSGPWYVVAVDSFSSGAMAHDDFSAGAIAADG